MVKFWLGPYHVEKDVRSYRTSGTALKWRIVTKSGQTVKAQINYKIDALTECAILNAQPKIIHG